MTLAMAGRAWTGPDGWHGVEGEEASSEQSITVGVSHISTSEPGPNCCPAWRRIIFWRQNLKDAVTAITGDMMITSQQGGEIMAPHTFISGFSR
ncbi:hypothetical protein MUG91_G261n13 [Manis pentadactyla]|nr:hypothetical protein MUG91_G261n13 [Manis pentadactyla]